jgi:hypothetical protein
MLDFKTTLVDRPAEPTTDVVCVLDSEGCETFFQFSVVARYDKLLGIASNQQGATEEESKEE